MKYLTLLICIFSCCFQLIRIQPVLAEEVVVYTSVDQIYSEPILELFEKQSGITIKAVYDVEASKTVGLVNRLIAEKNNPQADVYWANEPIRAEVLKQRGISAPYFSKNAKGIPDKFKDKEGYWTGFSARARVLVVNKNVASKPKSIAAYTNPKWKGKAVIANPLFGTTTTQIAALFSVWGNARAKNFMDLIKNALKIPMHQTPMKYGTSINKAIYYLNKDI